jgi:hypothetical protein
MREMGEVFRFFLAVIILIFAVIGFKSCASKDPIAVAIEEKEICVVAESKGISFMKCFDLVERKP